MKKAIRDIGNVPKKYVQKVLVTALNKMGKEVMCRKRLRVKRHKQKNNNRWVGANEFLASDPTDETRSGVPSHFQATLDQLE